MIVMTMTQIMPLKKPKLHEWEFEFSTSTYASHKCHDCKCVRKTTRGGETTYYNFDFLYQGKKEPQCSPV